MIHGSWWKMKRKHSNTRKTSTQKKQQSTVKETDDTINSSKVSYIGSFQVPRNPVNRMVLQLCFCTPTNKLYTKRNYDRLYLVSITLLK